MDKDCGNWPDTTHNQWILSRYQMVTSPAVVVLPIATLLGTTDINISVNAMADVIYVLMDVLVKFKCYNLKLYCIRPIIRMCFLT